MTQTETKTHIFDPMNYGKKPENLTDLIRSVQAGVYHGLKKHTAEYLAEKGTPISAPTIRYHLNHPEGKHTRLKREIYAAAWEVLAELHNVSGHG